MLHNRRLMLVLCLILLLNLFLLYRRRAIWNSYPAEYCRQNNLKLNGNFYSNLIYIPELKILFCDVPKAASTNLRRLIYVYYNQSQSYENLDREKIWLDYKDFFHQFYLTEKSKFIYQDTSLFKFLLVRHPFRRIYSAYADKFVSDDIENTISGWKQYEEKILLEMHSNETLLTIRRKDLKLDFRTFLLYIIHSIRNRRMINSHWEQIVQRCSVCLINYDWIGKIENFDSSKKVLLKLFQNIQFPSKTLGQQDRNQTPLDDYQLIEYFRRTIHNDDDFRTLVDYYRPDFQLFDYAMPNL